MKSAGKPSFATLAIATMPVLAFGQGPTADALWILTPVDGAYVTGRAVARAAVRAGGPAPTVMFFIDGRQECVVSGAPYECEWDAGQLVVEHHIRVVGTFANGRRLVQNVRTRGLEYSDAAHADVVQVTVTVGDGRGHFVRNLPQAAFRVWEDGRPQAISHFQSEDVPLDLVVALDISSSMTAALPKLKLAAREFMAGVSPRDLVTVLGFNDSIFTLASRSRDHAVRVQAIDRLAAWGATALYDVIIHALETLGREGGRKALVVFTDGEDQGSRALIEDVELSLQESDVTLYMIGQGRGTSAEPMKRVMRRLAEPTGGRALFTEDIDELGGAFAELLDELANQYLLGYVPTNTRRDGALRTIKVDVEAHTAVRARKAYRLPVGDR